MNGILVINKEKGITSFDVIRQLRKILHEKQIGHTGTLDPIATGVLVITLGDSCKLSQFLESDSKVYECEIELGISTDTYDITGTILKECNVNNVDEQIVDEALKSFIGKSKQTPPIYSAIKVNGMKLYDYARNNIDVKIEERDIEVYSIERTSNVEYIDNKATFKFLTYVSKGTYIRSLCNDIGEKLGIPCTMKELKRIKSGEFTLSDASTIQDIEEGHFAVKDNVKATASYPTILNNDFVSNFVKNGCKLSVSLVNSVLGSTPKVIRIITNNNLHGIYELNEEEKIYRAKRIWN